MRNELPVIVSGQIVPDAMLRVELATVAEGINEEPNAEALANGQTIITEVDKGSKDIDDSKENQAPEEGIANFNTATLADNSDPQTDCQGSQRIEPSTFANVVEP